MAQQTAPIDRVLGRLERVESSRNGTQFSALCPAHEDRNASLAISTGAEGQVLLFCHAGCSLERIVDALGLEMKDLFVGGKMDRVAVLEQQVKRLARTQREHAERLTKIEQLQASQIHLRYHRNLTVDTRTLWYQQGVYDEMIDKRLLGYAPECPMRRSSPSRTIPVKGYDGALINIRHRVLRPGKGGKYLPQFRGLGISLFNAEVLRTSHERVLVVEGEIKSIVLEQASYIVVGLMGQRSWKAEWLEWFDVGRVIIGLDPGADESAWRLGHIFVERGFKDVCVATFPLKPDDLIVRAGAGKADVDAILNLARPVRT